MAVLRGLDGAFYDVPEDQLQKYRLSDGEVTRRQDCLDSCGLDPSHEDDESDVDSARKAVEVEAAEVEAVEAEAWGWRNRWGLGWRNNVNTPTTYVRVTCAIGSGPIWVAVSQTRGRGDPGFFRIDEGQREQWSRHTARQVTIRVSFDGGGTVGYTMVHSIVAEAAFRWNGQELVRV